MAAFATGWTCYLLDFRYCCLLETEAQQKSNNYRSCYALHCKQHTSSARLLPIVLHYWHISRWKYLIYLHYLHMDYCLHLFCYHHSSKHSIYMFVNTGDNGEPTVKPSSCWYISKSSWKNVVCIQNINISIRLSIRMLVHSSREESDSNWFQTIDSVLFVRTLVNRLNTSKLTFNFYGWDPSGSIPQSVLSS